MQIKVTDKLYDKITAIAKELDMPRTQVIHMAILDLIEKLDKKEK